MPQETEPLIAGEQGRNDTINPSKSNFQFVVLVLMLWFGTFIAAADSTIVSTLMASIASDLNALDNISWVATAYLLAYSAFQPLYGKVSDIFGRKYVLLTSTFIFGVGCLICSIADSIVVLVIGRILNGIGAGGMMGMSVIVVSDHVPGRKRGLYSGIGNLAFATGAALGGVIGGAAQAYKGWRFAFTLQVPLCLLSMVAVSFNMDNFKPPKPQTTAHLSSWARIDIVGSWSLATGVCLLMMGATLGGTHFKWMSWQIGGLFAASIACLGYFIHWELNCAAEPVLPIHVLRNRTILCNSINLFFATGAGYSFMFYVPIYMYACLNYTPSQISHRMLAQFIGGATGSLGGGYIIQRTGKYYGLGIASTIVLFISGLMWVGLCILPPPIVNTLLWQGSAYAFSGLSLYTILTIALVSMMAAVPDYQSIATSAQYTFRGVGSSLLLAFSGAIFNLQLGKQLAKNVTGKQAEEVIERVSKSVEAIRQVPLKYRAAVIESYKTSSLTVFTLATSLAVICIVCSTLVEKHELGHH